MVTLKQHTTNELTTWYLVDVPANQLRARCTSLRCGGVELMGVFRLTFVNALISFPIQ